jgi:TatD DNase family protein
MIDSHAHILKENYENIDNIVHEIKDKGVIGVINASDKLETAYEVLELSKKYNNYLFPAIGIHPEHINEIDKLEELEELIKNNKIYAIGEIGLDYYYTKENKEEQKELFNKQLDLAEKYNLPVIIHTRESIGDIYEILKDRKLKGVIHCFNGSYEMAQKFIKLGYKLGIGGVLTFKNSKLYELIEKISVDDILLETDSPYLSPEPFRGKKNIPSNVFYVAKRIAEIKNTNVEEIVTKTCKNSVNLFDIRVKI